MIESATILLRLTLAWGLGILTAVLVYMHLLIGFDPAWLFVAGWCGFFAYWFYPPKIFPK